MEKNMLTVAVLDAVKNSNECLLCYLWLKAETRLMEHLLSNEVVMDSEFRERVLAAKGFCNYHMHLLYKTAYGGYTENGLGYALYMLDIVKRFVEQVGSINLASQPRPEISKSSIKRGKRRRKAFSVLCDAMEQAVRGEQPCPACESLWSSDEINLHTLVQMLEDKNFREDFKSSKGLCLLHTISAIRMIGQSKLKDPENATQILIEASMSRLRLAEHYLSEFIRKKNWKFRNEPLGPEVNADAMVLNLIAGVNGLYHPGYKTFPQCKSEGDHDVRG
jgi:hypothetical protein